jgi:hypothetical protein
MGDATNTVVQNYLHPSQLLLKERVETPMG